MRTNLFYSTALLGLALSLPAAAEQEPESSGLPVELVVVTADRESEPISHVGQSISVLDAQTIETRQSETVSDLLRTVPGVEVARNGGTGSLTSVFIRGADSDQTAALIDGVKLNDPSDPGGGFDFGSLLTGNIERIEVLRGPSSVLWGSQAIGGVVNVITIQPADEPAFNARGEYGYRNTSQFVANASGKIGALSASAGGGTFHTDGISAFDEHLGGKEKDGYDAFGINLTLNYALSSSVSIDARAYYADGTVGIDGFPPPNYVFADTRETAETREFVGYTGLNATLFDGRLHNRLGYAYTSTWRRNLNPDSAPAETFAGHGRNERLEYQGLLDVISGVQAVFGAEQENSDYATSSYGGPQSTGRATIASLYGQTLITPLDGLTLTGGARYDRHNRFGGATTLAGSAVYSPNAQETQFRASYSQGFKAPALFQLQSDYGNETLLPERAEGWDAGVTQRLFHDRLEAGVTLFDRTTRNLIAFITCNAPLSGICTNRPFGTYSNVGRAKAQGVELTLTYRPIDALQLSANYTYLDAKNRTPGDPDFNHALALRPRQSLAATADYRWPSGISAGATLTGTGASYDDPDNTIRLHGYTLVDLRASYPLRPGTELYARVENLFDAKYETVYQYGTLGRAAYIGIKLHY